MYQVTKPRTPRIIRTVATISVLLVSAGCSSSITRFDLPLFAEDEATGSLPPVPESSVGYGAANVPQPQVDVSGSNEALPGGFSQITVGQADTLYSLSRRYGISERNILAANRLDRPSDIQRGQRILIPPVTYRPGDEVPTMSGARRNTNIVTTPLPAPRTATSRSATSSPRALTTRNAIANTSPANSGSANTTSPYTVQSGDTLYGIARRHDTTAAELARANDIGSDAKIRVGQKLVMPGQGNTPQRTTVAQTQRSNAAASTASQAPGNQERRVASLGTNDATSVPVPATRPAHQADANRAAREQQARSSNNTRVASARPTSATSPLPQPDAMSSNQFRWPVRGRTISGFGPKSDGARNDGINIAVPAGTSIKAAENGVVAYAGNELEGYGNLILIRHQNDWVTAYAHTSRILVKRGDKVRRGQIIAQAGQTGSVDRPQLHFELRQGSRPVDPKPHMSGS